MGESRVAPSEPAREPRRRRHSARRGLAVARERGRHKGFIGSGPPKLERRVSPSPAPALRAARAGGPWEQSAWATSCNPLRLRSRPVAKATAAASRCGLRPASGASARRACWSTSATRFPRRSWPSFLTSTFGAPAAALGLIEGVSDGLAGRGAPRRRRARRRPAPAASHGGGRLHGDRGSLRADGGGLERVAGGRPLAIVAHAACAQAGPRGVLPERLTAAAR